MFCRASGAFRIEAAFHRHSPYMLRALSFSSKHRFPPMLPAANNLPVVALQLLHECIVKFNGDSRPNSTECELERDCIRFTCQKVTAVSFTFSPKGYPARRVDADDLADFPLIRGKSLPANRTRIRIIWKPLAAIQAVQNAHLSCRTGSIGMPVVA
jgi:hypothetical protein